MSKQRDYTDYLNDMLRYASLAQQFVAQMSYEEFATDEKTQLAVLHAITIIGEAASKIPVNVREQYPEVPWRTVIDTRNRLIHGYESIYLHLVWNVINDHLSPLKAQVVAILSKSGDSHKSIGEETDL